MAGFLKKLQSLVKHQPDDAPKPETGKPAQASAGHAPQNEAAQSEKTAPREKSSAPAGSVAIQRESEPAAAAPARAGQPLPSARPATPDAARKRQPLDPERVDLADAWEIQYRRKQFGCTELQLKQAVAAVGDAAAKVKLHLRNRSVPPKGGKQRFE